MRQWSLVIETCAWEQDRGRLFSRGHHSCEDFADAAVAGGWWEPGTKKSVVREYWRFVPIPDQDYPLTIIEANGPGRGAVPVTAEVLK